MARRRGFRHGRKSARTILAQAANKRFVNRVRAIARGDVETKGIKGQTNLFAGIPPGYSARSYVSYFNPFTRMRRLGDEISTVNNDPSNNIVIGDEFILTGLKLEWNASQQTINSVSRVRISLVSSDQFLPGGFDAAFVDTGVPTSTGNDLWLDSSETVNIPTFRRWNDRVVNVLASKEFVMVPQIAGAGANHQGKIYWRTNQKKTIAFEEQADGSASLPVSFLKNRNYYFTMEWLKPTDTTTTWLQPAHWIEAQFTVYYKDA